MSAIISTQPYLCYFNQGPDGPGYNDIKTCSGPHSSVQGGITASMAGGSWLGALISGFLSDKLGRKSSIQVGAVVWCVGSILVCASQNIGMLIVGRIVNGISVGVSFIISSSPISMLICNRSAQLKFQSTSRKSLLQQNVDVLLVPNNGLSHGES